ncbi:VOC family protein [Bacillus sp. B15-48]|uniref:VOC family protein n=1 Tax=Bacillus sp. B15-48 TaxID=1548601 RepID=UPI00193F96E0|nr:VOC family protein [Bacillus sp. B15-48]MBM4763131.1 glyoxalase/bleomycin resistance/extradiol dioxygenase family protein [Bacillus sp. B15-48]
MSKVKVFRLAYADFFSPEPEKMVDYYTTTMGYRITEEKDGVTYLSNGVDHHNIVITPGNQKGIRSYGYQLDGKLSLEEVQKQLQAQGFDSTLVVDGKPGVSRFLELNDPAGNIVELFTEIDQPVVGFGTSGILPLKLGHIAFYAKNFVETIEFYRNALGFTSTDKIGEEFANFLTCNYEHHVLNVVASDETRLHHIAYQLKDAGHQYASSDTLARQGLSVIWGPSRHTAGHNIATYHYDTDGNVIELYTDMDVYIPELDIFEPRPWHQELPLKPRTWEGLSSWGTEFEFNLAKI